MPRQLRTRAGSPWRPALVLLMGVLFACEKPADEAEQITGVASTSQVEQTQTAQDSDKPAIYDGTTCEQTQVAMRDGIKLTTRIHRPEDSDTKQYPVIVSRTPYARWLGFDCYPLSKIEDIPDTIPDYVSSGYVYVEQAIRGSYTSEGDIPRLIHAEQQNDSYDTVEWAARQPWSNGAVGLAGGSGVGVSATQGALAAPPSLKAVALNVTGASYFRERSYINGVFHLGGNLSWPEWTFSADGIIRRGNALGLPQEEIDKQLEQRKPQLQKVYTEWAPMLPVADMPHFKGVFDAYYEWLAHPTYDEYWEKSDALTQASKIQVPVLLLNAWQDLYYMSSPELYRAIRNSDASATVKQHSRLVMDIYGHSFDHGTPSFGPNVHKVDVPLAKEIPFFDKHLKGMDNGYEDKPAVELAIMVPPDEGNQGYSFMVTGDNYPLPDTTYRNFYLASGGKANTRNGDGALLNTPAGQAQAAADSFSYDPLNPVPTLATHSCCMNDEIPDGYKNGYVEQREIEERDDVLVYTSAPLEAPLVVVGPVEVKLFAQSSAPDTDFTARLVDVRPDGATHNILDGVVRASLRKGFRSEPSLIEPGKTYEYSIPLGPVGTVFPAGHRIRVQISSSNFPKLARNLNTGKSSYTTAETAVAEQTILHDKEHPSRLILPIVSGIDVAKRPVIERADSQ